MSIFEGHPITTGLLTGLKLKALQQELAQNAYKFEEFKSEHEHRVRMNALAEAGVQLENEGRQTQNAIAELNRLHTSTMNPLEEQLAQATQGSKIETANLAPARARADIAKTQADTGESTARGKYFDEIGRAHV